MPPPPRPPRTLLVSSLAAILLCTLACAFCLASVLHPWGIRQLGGLLLLPGFLGLGLTQYSATFRAKASNAETASRLYSFGGGFMVIAVVCLLLDVYRAGEGLSWPIAALGVLLLSFACWGRVGGRLNRDWAAALRKFEAERFEQQGETATEETPAYRPRSAVGWVALGVFLGATSIFYHWMGPKFGEHLAPRETPLALPAGASDVSYWIYAGITAFEFSVPEKDFVDWAEGQIGRRREDFPGLDPIKEAKTMTRYSAWAPHARHPHETVIEHGHHFGWREKGQSVDYAYDAVAGRAYYRSISQ